jgi:hypothetical protein
MLDQSVFVADEVSLQFAAPCLNRLAFEVLSC